MAGKTGHCVEIVKGGLSMSDKLITSAKVLCVIVGVSFSLMLVALFLSITWMALTSAGLVG
ncbi:hypothetical protein B9K94_001304 [Escherichia coli]|nr:hypothetical protein [Escherichia coli]EFE9077847.1 hypothetical protein [Escherichia coli]EFE9092713.1 hypothetical protein [Escherichia coli]EFE9140509.1 hypothetical protein [Escherichia coli]EFE9145677.1 hypothetical protein [Escherichia coli]